MVQLARHHASDPVLLSEKEQLYWKLDDGIQYGSSTLLRVLEERKFALKVTTPRERIKELYVRSQRGLPSYEMLNLLELKTLVGQRGLSIPAGQRDTPWSYRTLLERADDNATFRFTDLLPELRLQIYTHYFDSFAATGADIISQPPITGVSQSIRNESLPHFYGYCLFKADISASPSALQYSPRTDRLLKRTPTEEFGWIRNITVNLSVAGHDMDLIIDICNKSTPVMFFHRPSLRRSQTAPLTQECLNSLSSELDAFVRAMAAREGESKLQASDLDQLYGKVNSIISQHSGQG
jgi:hypothetical protein